MTNSSIKCYATSARFRAIVALAAPFGAILWIIYELRSQGYGLSEYFKLIVSGELDLSYHVLATAILLIWIVRYFPPAISALLEACVICRTGNTIVLGREGKFRISDIASIHFPRSFSGKSIEFILQDGTRHRQSVLFVVESKEELESRILQDMSTLQDLEQ